MSWLRDCAYDCIWDTRVSLKEAVAVVKDFLQKQGYEMEPESTMALTNLRTNTLEQEATEITEWIRPMIAYWIVANGRRYARVAFSVRPSSVRMLPALSGQKRSESIPFYHNRITGTVSVDLSKLRIVLQHGEVLRQFKMPKRPAAVAQEAAPPSPPPVAQALAEEEEEEEGDKHEALLAVATE